MKMHDFSKEQEDITVDGPKIFKPSLQLSAKQLPGLSSLGVGDRLKIQIDCTIADVVPPDAFDSRTSMIFDLCCERGVIISKTKLSKNIIDHPKVGGVPAVGIQTTTPGSGAFE
jgi:hypothetical protein